MSDFLGKLRKAIEPALAVRDSVGAVKGHVYLVTRSWYTDSALTTAATTTQDGYASDEEEKLLPSPRLKTYYSDVALPSGGAIQKGDIQLTGISAASYAREDLDATTVNANEERLYRVGDKMYQVIQVSEQYVTWTVRLRELTNQKRYV